MKAALYTRVSTEEQSRGLSLQSQREACALEVERRGWTLEDVVTDHASGKSLRRPGWERLSARLAAGEVQALVVSRLDRLSRSTLDFHDLLGRADREGWVIVCLHPNVDMSDPMGRAMAGVAAIFAQLEREMISMRQKESVAARRAAGTYRNRRPLISPTARRRIAALRDLDFSYGEIAEHLQREQIAPPGGGLKWHRSTVMRTVRALEAPEPAAFVEDDQDEDEQRE